MREKYLKICSFAKSRNMQIILFVLVSIVYLVCVVFALGISYFLYLPSIQQFLYVFGSFLSICLYYKTFEKLINKRNIFFNLLFLSFFILFFVISVFNIKLWHQIIKGEKMSNIRFIGVVNIERKDKIYVYQEDKAQKRR